MYEFEPRLPIDHVLAIVALVRANKLIEEKEQSLMLAGATLGEIGAFLKSRKASEPGVLSVPNDELPTTLPVVCTEIEAELSKNQVQALNPVLVALIKKLVELLLEQL